MCRWCWHFNEAKWWSFDCQHFFHSVSHSFNTKRYTVLDICSSPLWKPDNNFWGFYSLSRSKISYRHRQANNLAGFTHCLENLFALLPCSSSDMFSILIVKLGWLIYRIFPNNYFTDYAGLQCNTRPLYWICGSCSLLMVLIFVSFNLHSLTLNIC